MLAAHGIELMGSDQVLARVLADRLQQPVTGAAIVLLDLYQGRIHQSGQETEHLFQRDSAATADGLSSLQAPAPDKHRQPLK